MSQQSEKKPRHPNYLLFQACYFGKNSDVKDLLQSELAGVNAMDEHGRTPLFEACNEGHLCVCQTLLDCGAAVTLASDNFYNPLLAAASKGYEHIVDLLLESGADANATITYLGTTEIPLHAAVKTGRLGVVRKLIRYGANLRSKAGDISILSLAIVYGQQDVAEFLVTHGGIDAEEKDERGRTALSIAVFKGYYYLIQQMLKSGYNVNATTKDMDTPLHYACKYVNDDNLRRIVKLLVVNGADVNALNNERKKPVDYCRSRNREDIVELIQQFTTPVPIPVPIPVARNVTNIRL